MSKTQLKKVLATMTAPQIADLVVELYEARPEAKEYLDFFVKPDIDAKLEKARSAIRKEASRTSRGYSKMRSTRIKRFIKDIASLNPGDEPVCEIMTFAVETAARIGSDTWIKEVTQKAMARLLHDTLVMANHAGLLDIYLERIQSAVADMKSPIYRKNYFKELLADTIALTLNEL